MPYVNAADRKRLDGGDAPTNAGELNYAISRLVDRYIAARSPVRYGDLNEVVGVLECAKLELYRRVVVPYEDRKKAQHGDVYTAAV